MGHEDEVNQRKLLVVGDGASGKTCLLMTYTRNEFPIYEIPAMYNQYRIRVRVDSEVVEFDLCDTCGHDDYGWGKIRPLSYPGANVVLIVFSIYSHDSLKNVDKKWNLDMNQFCSGVPKILVGAKKDLRNNNEENRERTVTYEQGKEMAQKIEAVEYMECSAMHKEGLREIFEAAAKHALKHNIKEDRRCILL